MNKSNNIEQFNDISDVKLFGENSLWNDYSPDKTRKNKRKRVKSKELKNQSSKVFYLFF